MKVVIIEDEAAAVRNLTSLLQEIKPQAQIVAALDSIASTVDWISNNPMPDLVFMDIHLADGSAFEIFERVRIDCPIIFTTAYDEYALRAFKVNSIDYLLKPIDSADMEKAFLKLSELQPSPESKEHSFDEFIKIINKQGSYKTHFLIPTGGSKLTPISVDMIDMFYIEESKVKIVTDDGSEYITSQNLDEICESLNPSKFFRINRQYMISRHAVKDIDLWFNNRLSINLRSKVGGERILVSKARANEFKEWFCSGQK